MSSVKTGWKYSAQTQKIKEAREQTRSLLDAQMAESLSRAELRRQHHALKQFSADKVQDTP